MKTLKALIASFLFLVGFRYRRENPYDPNDPSYTTMWDWQDDWMSYK